MQSKMVSRGAERTFLLVFDKNEEIVHGLMDFASERKLSGGYLTGIGAFQDAVLGYFDPEKMEYKRVTVREQCEVLSLVGDIALVDGRPRIHAHVVLGKPDTSVQGGHLMEAHVWPILEVMLTETEQEIHREKDQETGLALLRAKG